MKILVNGVQSNLRFSSAHVIPGHESCGFIHGHSYFVDVEIEGERTGKFEFVVDFKDVKSYYFAISIGAGLKLPKNKNEEPAIQEPAYPSNEEPVYQEVKEESAPQEVKEAE